MGSCNCTGSSCYRHSLRDRIRKLGTKPSLAQRNEIAERRAKLQGRIITHQTRMDRLLPHAQSELEQAGYIDDLEDFLCEDEELAWHPLDDEDLAPERMRLRLPSTLGANLATDPNQLAQQELQLRKAQASAALREIRYALGEAAVFYRLQSRHAKRGKNTNTRSHDNAREAINAVRKHFCIYNRARRALLHLPDSSASLSTFKIIQWEDLKVSADIEHENRVGQRSHQLAWFWTIRDESGKAAGDISEWHTECGCSCTHAFIILI
jgi:hypothetical protein